MPEILAIIPARAGSKRIPDKNIKPLNGIPLIEHTIMSAKLCQRINHTVITSNIPSLSRYERKYEHLTYHQRAEVLCGDEVGDYDVISDVMNVFANEEAGDYYDLIVYLRPTTPFRADYHVTEAIKQMLEPDCGATGLRSVELMPESAFKCFTMPTPWLSPILHDCVDKTDWPNQKVTQTFRANGYIDIVRPETLAKGQLWGNWPLGYITPPTAEIDTLEDWQYAEWCGKRWVDPPMRYGRKTV